MAGQSLNWDDLRVLLEVARQRSVHAAAKRLSLDHSTVGRRIDRLEARLGRKLFDRTPHGVTLREDAAGLLEHVRSMDLHVSALNDALASDDTQRTEVVRIATMEGIASRYIARRVPALCQFAGNIRLELVSIPQMVDLSRKEADIFVSFFDPRLPGLASNPCASFSLHLYGSRSYLDRHGTPRSRQDLRNHRFVSYIEDLLSIDAVRWLDEVVTDVDVVFASNSVIAQCSAAVAGVGLALLPTFVAAEIEGFDRVLPDEVIVHRDVWLSVRREQMFSRKLKQTTRFLEHIFRKDEAFLSGARRELELEAPASC